jgi:hypothetical protein
MVIATVITLVHLVLPPKKIDNHVSIRLKSDYAKFEEAGS